MSNRLKYLFILGVGFGLGIFSDTIFKEILLASEPDTTMVRLDSGTLTQPLLICNIEQEEADPRLDKLENSLRQVIDQATKDQQIQTASVYYRELNSGKSLFINPEETFIPASLNKVPLMILAYLKAAQNPEFAHNQVLHEQPNNANALQLVPPQENLQLGTEYSIDELVTQMIKYSDNVAYDLLTTQLDYQEYLKVFADLRIPIENDEGITARDYSYFLRVLYNATLLDQKYSEKALNLLTQTTYTTGLKAGVPEKVLVAHKYGTYGHAVPGGVVQDRQLHDCGIIYAEEKPYLLCVMTKSVAELDQIESVIKTLSTTTYEFVTETH